MNSLPPPVGPTTRVARVLDRLATDEYLVEIAPDRVALHPTSSAGVQLSREARLAFALGPSPGERGSSTPLEPLVAMVDVPEGAETLARELAGRVGRSGLFYESHLADWIVGAKTREDLVREPQNNGDSPHYFPVTEEAAPLSFEPLVREQLAALERHEVRFAIPYGESRPAELVVAQERPQHGAPEGSGDWTSRLRLHLPELGEIDAKIRLSGNAISISLEAADPGTAALLSESDAPLRERLALRELHLARLEVDRHA